jgi:hypothetical protein
VGGRGEGKGRRKVKKQQMLDILASGSFLDMVFSQVFDGAMRFCERLSERGEAGW